jgi:hypothetical protein
MKKFAARLIGMAVSALLAVIGVVALEGQTQPAEAADASRFDPGLIISDSVFYDFATMTVDEIQRFLDSKVSNCIAKPTAPPCLKNYVMDTPAVTGEDGRCESLPAKTDQKSAQVIYDVARACKINPKVLLVTLQKEQGLITSPNPTEYKYRAALGMSCPDSNLAQCGKVDAGFFMQLYKGAGQLQWYNDPRGSYTYHKVGRVSNIRYDVSASCGTKPVLIKSLATAALYYYTPYTPNAAALANLYSTGDSCSAYGNRNFWRYFTDWFGSTLGGGFLLKGSGTDVYLIVDNNRYRITDSTMIDALEPLGPLGTVSDDYLNTFTLGQDLTRVIRSADNTYYLFDGGKRYVFTGCEQVKSFGFDCNGAVQLTSSQIAALASGGVINPYNSADKATYLIENGKRREILDTASAVEAGYSLSKPSTVSAAAFKHLPWGTPIVGNNVMFTNRTSKATQISSGSKIFTLDAETAVDVDLAKWLRASTGTLSSDGTKAIEIASPIQTVIKDVAGQHYLLTTYGKRLVNNGVELFDSATEVPDQMLAVLPTISKPLTAPAFVKTTSGKTIYLAMGSQLRATASASQRTKLASVVSEIAVQALPKSALAQIGIGQPIAMPMTAVKISSSKQIYGVDGLERMIKLSSPAQAASLGFGTTVAEIPVEQLRAYNRGSSLSFSKIACGDQIYIGTKGKYHAIEAEPAAHYPGDILTISDLSCSLITKSKTKLGRFIKAPDASLWLIDMGKRRLISTTEKYQGLLGEQLPYVPVDQVLFDSIPKGKAAGVTMPKTVPAEIPTPEPYSTAGPKPTPAPTESTTPSPTITPTSSPTASAAALTPGSLVAYGASLYLVNGPSKLAQFDAIKRSELFGLKNPKTIDPSIFQAYDSSTIIDSAKVKCGTSIYLVLLGTHYPISTIDASHYPGKSLVLSAENCALIKKSNVTVGRFVLSQTDSRIYYIDKTKRRPVLDEATYLALKGTAPAYVKIGPYLTSTFTLGAEMTLPTATPTPSATTSPSVTPSPSPTPSA